MQLTKQFIRNLERFRLVTFDITDTLLRFRRSPGIQYAETAAAYGYPNLNQAQLLHSFRTEFKSMQKEYPNYGKNTLHMDFNKWWTQLVLNIFKSIKSEVPESDVIKIANDLIRVYRTEKCWLHVDGSSEIISKLRQSGKIVGVVSNFDPSLLQILDVMNLKNFDFVITAYDCGILKPDKGIFDLALRKCNVRSDQALHIGNLFDLDYLGAKEAGWSSLLISQLSDDEIKHKRIHKDHVYPSLMELLQALEHKEIDWL